jgi:four helix bundle protein
MVYKKENIIMTKSYTFALEVIDLYKSLKDRNEYVLSKQFLRSGTAIGALIKEAEHAQSRADFINKMSIALKEANETEYWIALLKDSKFISEEEYNSIFPKSNELVKMLISIVKTTKMNN